MREESVDKDNMASLGLRTRHRRNPKFASSAYATWRRRRCPAGVPRTGCHHCDGQDCDGVGSEIESMVHGYHLEEKIYLLLMV